MFVLFCVRQIRQKLKKNPVLSFLCQSCGLLSNQPDPWTQPRSMDPDHMANRVPNRLCHLSLLNKKQTRRLVHFLEETGIKLEDFPLSYSLCSRTSCWRTTGGSTAEAKLVFQLKNLCNKKN